VRRTGGFTLVELIITVAIIGIVAGILVYSLNNQPKRVKSRAEVQAMFGAFHAAEAAYNLEKGTYYSTGTDEGDIFPSTLSDQAQDVATLPDEWLTLRVQTDRGKLYCGYVAVAGAADDDIPGFAEDFGMVQPVGSWYALYAECDMDGNGTLNGTFFSSSTDVEVQRRNELH
jgi:prepilin-type N-terminal cleavage/methylation domain-containing protein